MALPPPKMKKQKTEKATVRMMKKAVSTVVEKEVMGSGSGSCIHHDEVRWCKHLLRQILLTMLNSPD